MKLVGSALGALNFFAGRANEQLDDLVARFAFEFIKGHDSSSGNRSLSFHYPTKLPNGKSMPLPPLTRDQVRSIDQTAVDRFGMTGLVLMENAGRGAAEIIDRVAPSGRIVILCGRGNNAGDGYVIARHLELAEREVQLVSIVELGSLSGDADANARIAVAAGIEILVLTEPDALATRLESAAVIVDGLLGTGAQGDLREPYASAVRAANAAPAIRIAIDVPTGLDCDTGHACDPTFRADHTISFVAAKVGFDRNDADTYVGAVHVVGIGVPRKLLAEFAEKVSD